MLEQPILSKIWGNFSAEAALREKRLPPTLPRRMRGCIIPWLLCVQRSLWRRKMCRVVFGKQVSNLISLKNHNQIVIFQTSTRGDETMHCRWCLHCKKPNSFRESMSAGLSDRLLNWSQLDREKQKREKLHLPKVPAKMSKDLCATRDP